MNKGISKRVQIFLVFLGVLVLFFAGSGQEAQAARHTLNDFQAHETIVDGRKALRLEIGMTGDDLKYQVAARPALFKQIIIDMAKTDLGKIKNNISFQSSYARSIKFYPESENLRAVIQLDREFTGDDYRVHVEPRDRRAGKPYRLVIDIFDPSSVKESSSTSTAVNERVDGVKGHTILIDPGHGGSDSGAVGPNGTTEASVTLAVSKKVRNILSASGANVVMTRDTDRDVFGPNANGQDELQARVDVGERAGADIFLSIHCNAFSNPNSNGMETYYYAGSWKSERLATLLNEELAAAGGLYNRGVKTANFYVIKHSSMPSSLAELAFVTNPREEALLSDDSYQEKLAGAIARAIGRFFSK